VQTADQDVIRYLEHGFECWNRRAIKEMMDMYARDAEGRGSGAPAGTEATIFYTLEDGLIARAEFEPGRSPQLQG